MGLLPRGAESDEEDPYPSYPEIKAKVALATVREEDTIPALLKRFGIHANQIESGSASSLENAARAFSGGAAEASSGSDREAELLKKIGELMMECDCLSKGLGRLS